MIKDGERMTISYYIEYEIIHNQLGLLGEIASLMGRLKINIETINGFHHNRSGILITADDEKSVQSLASILQTMETIRLIKVRKTELIDRLAVRHGRYFADEDQQLGVYRFTRDEIGILVDFLAQVFKAQEKSKLLIGVRGLPRVGKTESIVAACVSANKQWVFVSSTLFKQTMRESLYAYEYSKENIFIIDGIASSIHASGKHLQLVHEIIGRESILVVEHPDIFCQNTKYKINDFDYMIELRSSLDEDIAHHGSGLQFGEEHFGTFDLK